MAKKSIKKQEAAATKQLDQRLLAIREFNMNNAGRMWIDPEKVPTEEDVLQAKTEWEERSKALVEKNDYLIADANNSVRVATFLQNFIKDGFWAGSYWKGVINFNTLLTEFLEEANKEPKDFVLPYAPMQFCYLMLENYAGQGLAAAIKMSEIWEEYVPIYDTFRDHIEYYKKEVEEIRKLKERWGMMAQGYYLILLEPEKEPEGQDLSAGAPTTEPAPEQCKDCGCDECKCDTKVDDAPADDCPPEAEKKEEA